MFKTCKLKKSQGRQYPNQNFEYIARKRNIRTEYKIMVKAVPGSY